MTNKRIKLFLENFFIYGIGSMLSKIAPLLMLPIVTRLMPDTTYYGLNDLSNIIVYIGSAIALLGMYDAMFRMFFESGSLEYKKEICSSTLNFVSISGVILCIILFLLKSKLAIWIFGSEKYVGLLNFTIISVFFSILSTIVSAPSRMQNKRMIFIITNIISPIIGYSISIPMLMKKSFLYALPTASLVTSIIMLIVFYWLNKDWFSIKILNLKIIKELLKIGIPLMPTFIVYWVFTSFDRIMISKMIGNEFVGIYGVGVRFASVSQFIYTAFAGGWQYFAFSTMKDDDQVELTSKVFEYLALVSFSFFIIIVPFTNFIFRLFLVGDYVSGYITFPYLFLAPLILMLYQTIANQFLVIKKTLPSTIILLIGAVINIILNYILIRLIGIEGVAIATLIGYLTSVIIACYVLSKMKLIFVVKRTKILFILTMIYTVLWRTVTPIKVLPALLFSILMLLIFYYLYKNNITYQIKRYLNNKK